MDKMSDVFDLPFQGIDDAHFLGDLNLRAEDYAVIKAVNAHDQLVEALKKSTSAIEEALLADDVNHNIAMLLAVVESNKKAIALAKGE